MQSILEQITDWLKSMIISGIMGNLSGMFDSVNQQVGQIAGDVGTTPANFSPAVFSMIRNISESVILPIAGMVLTFIACYELIQMLIDRNNLHDVDTWMFFKWVFKTFVAVIMRITRVIGHDRLTLSAYIDHVLTHHFNQCEDAIKSLYARNYNSVF